jgi:Hint module
VVLINSDSASKLIKSCFAGSETVKLESGETKPISEVRAGDRVLAADSFKRTLISEVVFVPHTENTDKAAFTHITTTKGRDIKMTGGHVIPAGACGSTSPLPDVHASSVTVGDCIMTVSGMEKVSAVETVDGQGLYTIVTKEEYVVVNGIIASPFAYNHMLANLYYNIHRFVYAYVPGVLTVPLVRSANEVKSSIYLSYYTTRHHLTEALLSSATNTYLLFISDSFHRTYILTGPWTIDSTRTPDSLIVSPYDHTALSRIPQYRTIAIFEIIAVLSSSLYTLTSTYTLCTLPLWFTWIPVLESF